MAGLDGGEVGSAAFAILCAVFLQTSVVWAAETEPSLPQPDFEISTVISNPARAVRPRRTQYTGAIIDALAHLDPGRRGDDRTGKTGEDVTVEIARAGVAAFVLMPTPNEGLGGRKEDGTEQKIELASAQPGRLRVFCGGDYLSNWLADAQRTGYREAELSSKLGRLNRELAGGVCAGLGEFGLLHFNKQEYQNIIQLRPTFAAVLEVIDVVAKNGSWIQLHAEPMEPEGVSRRADAFGALALWHQRHPDLKFILSHTAMTSAVNAKRLLAAYPNAMMTIKLPPRTGWTYLEPVSNERGLLYEDWAELFDEMPERFMVGSDAKFDNAKHGSGDNYPRLVKLYRDVLGSLKPSAAELIANGNARKVFKF